MTHPASVDETPAVHARGATSESPFLPATEDDIGPDWRVWLGLGITAVWLLLGAAYVSWHLGWRAFLDQPADVLGSFLEGAFAPLAFLWLVIGYFLQQKELSQNTDALRRQLREVQRTAEQAVIQSRTIAANERHARQGTFLELAERVHGQLGSIAGFLFMSSQGSDGTDRVSGEEFGQLWADQKRGDPEVFARKLLELYVSEEDDAERHALFYGTEVRARHSNHIIFTFERLLARAREADSDGMIEDAVRHSAHGYLYRILLEQRELAPAPLADITRTGREVRL
ncbi:MAG: hypothetical protein V2I63_00320 [Pseudomonadales bacterium]|jgi:hypothetical protein|nr:hypothetical protein [Pseudomonadales bacterium]